MSGYVNHAWRHRPKSEGGTDPIPVQTGGGQLFNTHFPRLPVVSGSDGHRRWPGGVVVVSAYAFNVNGTVANNTNQNSLNSDGVPNFKVVTETQDADSGGGASVTLSFTPEEVGLIPNVLYQAVVSWRHPTGGVGFVARAYIKRSLPSAGYLLVSALNNPTDYFGMSTASTLGWTAADETIEVVVGCASAGPSEAVEVDYLVFLPVGVIPTLDGPTPPPPSGLFAGYFRSLAALQGPTASYVGSNAYAPFSNDVWTDSQVVRDVLDPDFDFSFAFGIASAYFYAEYDSYYPGNATYPRHIYLPVRLANGADNDFLWDQEAFVTLLENGSPTDSAPVITSSWHLIYLGCHVIDLPNSPAVGLWRPPAGGADARSPFDATDGSHDIYCDGSIYGATSYLDQIEWNE